MTTDGPKPPAPELAERVVVALEKIAAELPQLRERIEECTDSIDHGAELGKAVFRELRETLKKSGVGSVLGAALGKVLGSR